MGRDWALFLHLVGVLLFVGAGDPIRAVERPFERADLGVEAIPGLVTAAG